MCDLRFIQQDFVDRTPLFCQRSFDRGARPKHITANLRIRESLEEKQDSLILLIRGDIGEAPLPIMTSDLLIRQRHFARLSLACHCQPQRFFQRFPHVGATAEDHGDTMQLGYRVLL